MAEEQKTAGALAVFSKAGLPALDPKVGAAALKQASQDAASGGGDITYLTYSGKKSRWSLGKSNDEPDPETVFILDPKMTTSGWICWKGGKPAKKHEWNVLFEGHKAKSEDQLEDLSPYNEKVGEGWQQSSGISMFDADSPGDHIYFSTSSISGKNALSELTEAAGDLWEEQGTEFPPLAVVTLSDEQFEAQGQWNGKPVFNVEAWVSVEEVQTFIEIGDDGDIETLIAGGYDVDEEPPAQPEPEPKAKKKRRRKAA